MKIIKKIAFIMYIIVLLLGCFSVAGKPLKNVMIKKFIIQKDIEDKIIDSVKIIYPNISSESMSKVENYIRDNENVEKITYEYVNAVNNTVCEETDISKADITKHLDSAVVKNSLNIIVQDLINMIEDAKNLQLSGWQNVLVNGVGLKLSSLIQTAVTQICNNKMNNLNTFQIILIRLLSMLVTTTAKVIIGIILVSGIIYFAFAKKNPKNSCR